MTPPLSKITDGHPLTRVLFFWTAILFAALFSLFFTVSAASGFLSWVEAQDGWQHFIMAGWLILGYSISHLVAAVIALRTAPRFLAASDRRTRRKGAGWFLTAIGFVGFLAFGPLYLLLVFSWSVCWALTWKLTGVSPLWVGRFWLWH